MRRMLQAGIVLLIIWPVLVLAADPVVTATWTPPTTGSPVHHYTFRLFEDGVILATYSDIPDTFLVIPEGVLERFSEYTADVAGVDVLSRQGPWSDPSTPYTWDEGAPGGCSAVAWEVQP